MIITGIVIIFRLIENIVEFLLWILFPKYDNINLQSRGSS